MFRLAIALVKCFLGTTVTAGKVVGNTVGAAVVAAVVAGDVVKDFKNSTDEKKVRKDGGDKP